METTLEAKKQRVLKRLNSTIESANALLCEINQELEAVTEEAAVLETTAQTYSIWISKH